MIKEIVSFTGYFVTDEGRVFSDRSGMRRELKPGRDKDGYLKVKLRRDDGVCKSVLVHRLVATTFIPNPDNLPCINHKNEIKDDNRVENIEWCNHKYNSNYGTRNKRASEAMIGNTNRLGKTHTVETKKKMSEAHKSSPKVYCVELNKTFDSYAECNHEMAEYLGLKSFNVGKIIKLQNDYYKKYNLHFCVVPVSDFDLPF